MSPALVPFIARSRTIDVLQICFELPEIRSWWTDNESRLNRAFPVLLPLIEWDWQARFPMLRAFRTIMVHDHFAGWCWLKRPAAQDCAASRPILHRVRCKCVN